MTQTRLVQSVCARTFAGWCDGLDEVIARLRAPFALGHGADQAPERSRGSSRATLEPEDEALFRRCDAVVKRLKGTARRPRREAEGYDDVNTFGVLAAEGFLPGLRTRGWLRARHGGDSVLAHWGDGVRRCRGRRAWLCASTCRAT